MSELPPTMPEWQRCEEAVSRARQAIGDEFKVGTIAVVYDSPAWDTGQVWIKASCDDCGSSRVMRASERMHVYHLALSQARYGCAENGHDQAGQIERINGVPVALGTLSAAELLDLEEDCIACADEAQADLMILRDVREGRFLNQP